MLTDLNKHQRALADYMSDLSEEAYSSGWMNGLEYVLWEAMEGKVKSYGRLSFNESIINNLNQLSQEANGWIVFDEGEEEKYLSFEDWNKKRGNYRT